MYPVNRVPDDASNFFDARKHKSCVSTVSEQRKTLLEDSRLSPRHARSLACRGWAGATHARNAVHRPRGTLVSSLVSLLLGGAIMRLVTVVVGIALLIVAAVVVRACSRRAKWRQRLLLAAQPDSQRQLTVFPVVASRSYDTAEFLTLDEGLRSGDVVVTEAGQARGLIRHRHGDPAIIHPIATRRLTGWFWLITRSGPCTPRRAKIVTGGKQDRVIGKDRIIPAESDPVEPERLLRRAPDAGCRRTASTGSAARRRCWRSSRRSRGAKQSDGREGFSSKCGTASAVRRLPWRRTCRLLARPPR